MPSWDGTARGLEKGLVPGLLLLFLLAALGALRSDSSVADEHPHILSGYLYWTSGRFAGGFDNPPLGQLLVSAPLVALRQGYRYPSDERLWLCRLPVLLLALGLGLVVWRWGWALGGASVGLWALLGFALTPELLAHGHLATVDLPLTFCWWIALWCWRGFLQTSSPMRRWSYGGGFALAFAVAALTKFTGFLLLPAVGLVTAALGRDRRTLREALLLILGALALVWLVAWPVYGFGSASHGLPERLAAALGGKLAHRTEVRFAYLAGQRSPTGFLAYYMLGLLLKTPLPLLGLALLGTASLGRGHAWRDLALLVLPASVLVVTFSLLRVNIGVRHVLPVAPALVLLAAAGLAALGRRGRPWQLVRALVVALWAIGVARVHPQYLAYFNELGGGPAGGARWLLDSNLAWGQDDGRLAKFLAEAATRGETWSVDPDPPVPRPGRFAVDVNTLHDLQRRTDRPHEWLRLMQPAGSAGWSWPLFRLEEKDFERAAATHPESPAAIAAYAEVLAARGEESAADSQLERAAARFTGPARGELARLAAEGAARRRAWGEALGWAERGLEEEPGNADLAALVRWYELERKLERAASRNSWAAARAALELGLFRAESGQVREALPDLQQAAAALQDTLDARRTLAVALARLGEYEAAWQLLNESSDPGLREERELCRALGATRARLRRGQQDLEVPLLRELGRAGFENGRYDEALEAFLAILRQHPEDPEALAFAGEIQVRSKLRLVPAELRPRPVGRSMSGGVTSD